MSDNRSIQKSNQNQRAGAIMAPRGPAIIQVIDIPAGYGAPAVAGPAGRKVGGINILGAILRRWWLVLIVTVLIGGAGVYAGNNFVKPVYIATAKVSWIDRTGSGDSMQRLISQATDVLTSREIPLLVAADPDMQSACPWLVQGRDLNDPSVQRDVIAKLKDVAVADSAKLYQTVTLQVTRRDSTEAARMANAIGRAFVTWCQNQMKGDLASQIDQLKQNVEEIKTLKAALTAERTRLMVDNNIDRDATNYAAAMAQASKLIDDQMAARIQYAAAEAKLKELENNGRR